MGPNLGLSSTLKGTLGSLRKLACGESPLHCLGVFSLDKGGARDVSGSQVNSTLGVLCPLSSGADSAISHFLPHTSSAAAWMGVG